MFKKIILSAVVLSFSSAALATNSETTITVAPASPIWGYMNGLVSINQQQKQINGGGPWPPVEVSVNNKTDDEIKGTVILTSQMPNIVDSKTEIIAAHSTKKFTVDVPWPILLSVQAVDRDLTCPWQSYQNVYQNVEVIKQDNQLICFPGTNSNFIASKN